MSLSGKRFSKYLRGCETEDEPIQGKVWRLIPREQQKSVWSVPQSDCIEQHLLRKGQGASASSPAGPALGHGCWGRVEVVWFFEFLHHREHFQDRHASIGHQVDVTGELATGRLSL